MRGRAGGRVREDAGSSSLPLPPPPRLAAANSSAAAASIRAHLARTASGVDAQPSPRSLLSRILLRGGGDGGSGGGGGFGCRVRLPRRYGGGLREERKDGAEQGETPRVKVVEPPPPPLPELPLETPRSSLGSAFRGRRIIICTKPPPTEFRTLALIMETSRASSDANAGVLSDSAGRKKPEEELVSMNLGLGASLVLLLSKSAVELNKMVELRAQMEALVSEIRQAARYREEEEKQAANHPASVAAAAAAGPATSQESDGGSSATTTAVKDPIAFPAADADAASNCSRTAVVMDLMEAELQAELNRMQQQRGRGGTVVHGHGGDSRIAPTRGLEVRAERKITSTAATAVRHHVPRRTCTSV